MPKPKECHPVFDADFLVETDGGNVALIAYKGDSSDVKIPSGITSIGRDAFSNCVGLKSISHTK